jgi:hypothetical protein
VAKSGRYCQHRQATRVKPLSYAHHPREQASANFIVKASDKNLGEEDSRWHWRSHTILDDTWMLPNVDKVKG